MFKHVIEMEEYKIPAQTRIGHVHLKVSDLQKSLDFYSGLLGFDTWHSKGAPHAPEYAPGLYHTAILYPERKDLAVILQRLIDAKYPITGASDHGVSEAIYLDDPDGNGVELYWDRPHELWPLDENGELTMFTERLDIEGLLREK
jgi:catechol 2,3-dioxygenase